MIKFLQINIGERRAAHHLILATIEQIGADIILVTEPNCLQRSGRLLPRLKAQGGNNLS